MPVDFNNEQIRTIIENLQLREFEPVSRNNSDKPPWNYAACGRDPAPTLPPRLVTHFDEQLLAIQSQKKEALAASLPSVESIEVTDAIADLTLQAFARTLDPVSTAPSQRTHEMAQRHQDLLQLAYHQQVYTAAPVLMKEILKLFNCSISFDSINNLQKNLQHDPITNRWILVTTGTLDILGFPDLPLGLKLQIESSAIFSAKPKPSIGNPPQAHPSSTGFLQGIGKKNQPTPAMPPFPNLSKYGAHGFLLDKIRITDPNSTDSKLGLEHLFIAYAKWKKTDHPNFRDSLKVYLNTQKSFGKTMCSSLAKVLTHQLFCSISSLSDDGIRQSAIDKMERLLCGQNLTCLDHTNIGQPDPNAFTFGELAVLRLGSENFTYVNSLLPHPGLQIADRLAKIPPRTVGLLKKSLAGSEPYDNPAIQRFITALTGPRSNELPEYGFAPSGGFGYCHPGTSEYGTMHTDCLRRIKFQGMTLGLWQQKFGDETVITTDKQKDELLWRVINSIIGPQDQSLDMKRSSNRDQLGRIKLDDDYVELEGSDNGKEKEPDLVSLESEDERLKFAKVHLEVLKRTYNQSVSTFPYYLVMQAINAFGLGWQITSLERILDDGSKAELKDSIKRDFGISEKDLLANQANATTGLSYDNKTGFWRCKVFSPKVITKVTVDGETPIVLFDYICTSAFKMPALDGINLNDKAGTIIDAIINLPYPCKGFEIEDMILQITVQKRSRLGPRNYLQLIRLFFKWVITPTPVTQELLFSYLIGFMGQL